MSEKEQEQFQSNNICWICKKLIDDDDEKVRDHCHGTGRFRGAVHWSYKQARKIHGIFFKQKVIYEL